MPSLFRRKLHLHNGEKIQFRPKPVRVPIRAKITFPYLLLALILALGAGYMVYRVLFDTVEERYTNQLIEAGKLSSGGMVREENRLLETLRLLAQTQGISQAIQARDGQKLRELSFGITVDHREEVVEFLDAAGNPILSMHHRSGGNVEEYSFSQGGEASSPQQTFVKKVIQGQADLQGDKYAGVAESSFFVSGPVYDPQGAFVGIVLVGKTLPTLVRQMGEATRAQVTLYGMNGQIAASTHLEPPAPLLPEQVSTLLQQNNGSYKRELISSEINYSELSDAWIARGQEPLGLIGTALPKTFLVSASRVTRLQIYSLISLAVLLVLLMGIYVANLITQPIIRLMLASNQVAGGNLQVQIPPSSNDEVGVLTQTFNQMVKNLEKSKQDLVDAYDSTLEGWSKALELRDEQTSGHTQRVTEMTLRLAKRMGLTGEELVHIRRGAMLHDIGKMGIQDSILRKPGKLTDEEWAIMRTHPQMAVKMLYHIEYLRPALTIPACHHEKWDGSGYPEGLKGEEIPLEARIFAIADVWDALRSERYYRKALATDEVLNILRSSSGSHFDPTILAIFLQLVDEDQTLKDALPVPEYETPRPA
jgi:HD-GYP domain-containing protein (c-di-GMP phosphodiesterase class II)